METTDVAGTNQPTEAPTFLGTIDHQLDTIQSRLYELYGRLQRAGFYGKPQSAPTNSGAVKPEEPDSVRHHINGRLINISDILADIENQITQLA